MQILLFNRLSREAEKKRLRTLILDEINLFRNEVHQEHVNISLEQKDLAGIGNLGTRGDDNAWSSISPPKSAKSLKNYFCTIS